MFTLVDWRTPYHVLEVHAESTDAEIRAAYQLRARQHHPDRGGDADKFAAVVVAYRAIATEALRERWRQAQGFTGAKPCGACRGRGCKQIQRGFTNSLKTRCGACGGSGF